MSGDEQARGVSIALATFNGERYLEPLLQSLACQTMQPRELVVGDDGSQDGTIEIVSEFARSAPFPVTITLNQHRLGFSDNFLALAGSAVGPLIAFCDQDDVWHPAKLERTSAWFRDPEVGLVLHRTLLVDESLRSRGRHFPPIRRTEVRGPRRVDPWFPCPGLAIVARRSLLDQVAGRARPPSRDLDGHPMDHDEWAYLVAATLGSTVLLGEDLAFYRQHFQSYLGAPPAGLREQLERGLRYGARDYLRPRAEMYEALADFWDRFAVETRPPRFVADRAAASAVWYGRLAASQRARASIHDPRVGRARRALRALSLVASGVYRSPVSGGVGARALIGDLLDFIGSAQPASTEVTDEVAARIARARADGLQAEAVAEALSRDGVPPPYGRRWSVAMVRDIEFRRGREGERRPPTSSASGVSSPPGSTPAQGSGASGGER